MPLRLYRVFRATDFQAVQLSFPLAGRASQPGDKDAISGVAATVSPALLYSMNMLAFLLLSKSISQDMFGLGLPVAEKILRPVVVYIALVILLRVFGKRELAQLNPFDLVVLLSVSNTVQNAIIGDDNSVTGGLIGAAALFGINYLVVRFLFKHKRLDEIFEGTPTVLIERGEVRNEGLAKELLTKSELMTVLHKQGFSDAGEVECCVLEPGGAFFVQGKKPAAEEVRHKEIIGLFEGLSRQIEQLRQQLAADRHTS